MANDVTCGFGGGLVFTKNGEIIHLAEEADSVTLEGGVVAGLVIDSGVETNVRGGEDAVDVGFPKVTGFRVTLEGSGVDR